MRYQLKIPRRLFDAIHADLDRAHPFALERVGFLGCRFAKVPGGSVLVLANSYHPVADAHYVDDPNYGALVNSAAFRSALQVAISDNVGLFHIHRHEHTGKPKPSPIDLRETRHFVPDFFHVKPNLPHGAIILSRDSASGRVWLPRPRRVRRIVSIDTVSVIGMPQEVLLR